MTTDFRAAARWARAGGGGVDPGLDSAARADSTRRMKVISCRPNCGACCIAPSISSPMPGMPDGKKAGERCAHLLADFRCELFGHPSRPAVCASLQPTVEMCGSCQADAMQYLGALELETAPDSL